MTTQDISLLIGQLFVCWVLGWGAGYVLTQFKRGIDQVV